MDHRHRLTPKQWLVVYYHDICLGKSWSYSIQTNRTVFCEVVGHRLAHSHRSMDAQLRMSVTTSRAVCQWLMSLLLKSCYPMVLPLLQLTSSDNIVVKVVLNISMLWIVLWCMDLLCFCDSYLLTNLFCQFCSVTCCSVTFSHLMTDNLTGLIVL